MRFVQGATELLRESERNGCTVSTNYSLQAEFAVTGQRGRPRFLISKDQLDFLLDLRFTCGEIASLLGVKELLNGEFLNMNPLSGKDIQTFLMKFWMVS